MIVWLGPFSRLITGNYAIHTYEIDFANLVESSTFTISFGWQTIVVTAPKRPNRVVTHADHKDRLDGLGGRLNRVLTPHASPNLTLRVISQLISIALNPEPSFPHIPLTQGSHFSDWWHCYAHAVCIFKSCVHFLANKLWAGVQPQRSKIFIDFGKNWTLKVFQIIS